VSGHDRRDIVFGPFLLNRHRRSLSRDGVAVPLRGRAFDVLAALATSSGQTLNKDALLGSVWPGRAVEENNLQVHISALRKLLGDEWIVTVPGCGYRLLSATSPDETARTQGSGNRPGIAVLPFVNLSGDPHEEYFADGIAHELITDLSHNRSLLVVSRNSSFSYRGRTLDVKIIAKELGVRYVVEGAVRRSGQQIRVNAELIDAADGGHLWAERYHRNVADIFAVQDEIAAAVATAIGPAVVDAEQRHALRKPPAQLDAWAAHQRGLWHWARGGDAGNDQARTFFEHAVALDPLFASPHAMLAFVQLWDITLGIACSMRENLATAENEARTAIELDPDDAMTLALLSWISFYHGDLTAALERADRAIAANHNDGAAHMAKGNALVHAERPMEAREPLRMVLRLNPRDTFGSVASMNLGICDYFERNYELAVDIAERTVRAHPSVPFTYRWLAASLGQLGRTDEALEALRQAMRVSPGSFAFFTQTRPPWMAKTNHDHLLEGLRKAGWLG
jgi:adenylate cyclase